MHRVGNTWLSVYSKRSASNACPNKACVFKLVSSNGSALAMSARNLSICMLLLWIWIWIFIRSLNWSHESLSLFFLIEQYWGIFLVPEFRGNQMAASLEQVRPKLPRLREAIQFPD